MTFHQTAAPSHGSSSVAVTLSSFPAPTHRRLTGECKGGELARQRSCDDGAEAVRGLAKTDKGDEVKREGRQQKRRLS